MTIDELINHLTQIPGAMSVYGIDKDGDWLPLRPTDIRYGHVTKLGRHTGRDDDFYILYEDDHDPPNGVGIGV
jgi:hypothetical protein